jgi:glycosyltransferase involved in cell wall biosynthesis
LETFLSIIVPALNEERRLPSSLKKIIAFLEQQPFSSELIVVDNGSQDRTAEIVLEFAKDYPALRLIQTAERGKGLAVRLGMLAAKGEYRFICDADLSMPIEEVSHFLPPEQTAYDVAIASREIPGSVRYHEPVLRHWVGRVFNGLVRYLAVPGFQDTQCGFKCFRAAVAQDLFSVQRLNGWTFDVEVLHIALRRGYRVIEVPISWYYNPGSRIRLLKDSWDMFTDLFRIRRNYRQGLYAPRAQATPPFEAPST